MNLQACDTKQFETLKRKIGTSFEMYFSKNDKDSVPSKRNKHFTSKSVDLGAIFDTAELSKSGSITLEKPSIQTYQENPYINSTNASP